MHRSSALVALIAVLACEGGTARTRDGLAAPAGSDALAVVRVSTSSAAATVPPAVPAALGRFRDRAGPQPDGLSDAATDRDEIVARYVRALEAADTAAFGPLSVSAAEFGWLYYPHSMYVRPPHALDVDVAWMLIAENSRKGIGRSLREYGGRPLGFTGYRCAAEPVIAGPNRLWHECFLEVRSDGAAVTRRFFGVILERQGRFKFLSYANDL
jgi:hypothetical protein